MAQSYLESIIVLGMFFMAWRIWKMWIPEAGSKSEPQPKQEDETTSQIAPSLFDVISRWNLWGPDPEEEQGETEAEEQDERSENDV